MNPSPYMAARETSNNLGSAFQRVRDENAIESILSGAMSTGDPAVLQDSIGKILSQVSPERQGVAVQYLQNTYNNIVQKQEKSRLEAKEEKTRREQQEAAKKAGVDANLPPALQKVQLENKYSQDRLNNILGGQGGNVQGENVGLAAGKGTQIGTGAGPGGNIFSNLSDDQLVSLSGEKGYGAQAKEELKRRQADRKIGQRQNELVFKTDLDRANDVIKKADEAGAALPQKRSALQTMHDAIINRNLGFWTKDNLAEITGIEGLRSPEGALFKTAGKEYFLGSIARAGARPNQWVEQQISDMLTKIGRSTEANLSVERALQNELDIEEARGRFTYEIADELRNTGDGSMRDLGRKVNQKLADYAASKQEELYNDLRAIKSIGELQPQKFHKVSPGTQVSDVMVQALLRRFNNDPEKAMAEAQKLGYSF